MALKFVTYTTTTALGTGLGTINITVPGTFVTLDYKDPTFSGRFLQAAQAWFESRASGDKITNIQVKDNDNVTGQGVGTVIFSLHDTGAPGADKGLTQPPGGPLNFAQLPNIPEMKLASGLHLVFTFQKAIASVDTCVINLAWDDLS